MHMSRSIQKAEKVRGCQRAESGSGACRCWPSALALRGQYVGGAARQFGDLEGGGCQDLQWPGESACSGCLVHWMPLGCAPDGLREAGDRAGTGCSASPAPAAFNWACSPRRMWPIHTILIADADVAVRQ